MDYRRCKMSLQQIVLALLQSIVLVGAAAYFLYRSIWGAIALVPLGIWWFRDRRNVFLQKRQQELRWEFKEMLLSVSASLQAGYSVENAFREAKPDMEKLYGNEADIVRELSLLEHALGNSIPIEQVLGDLGKRSGVREIRDFAQVFAIGKRSGADMGDMIGNTVHLISEKMETAREIKTVMSAKVMEQRVMCLVPFGIMIYVNLTSPGFFAGLYHNLYGVIFMTVCLFLYLGAVWMAQKVVQINW